MDKFTKKLIDGRLKLKDVDFLDEQNYGKVSYEEYDLESLTEEDIYDLLDMIDEGKGYYHVVARNADGTHLYHKKMGMVTGLRKHETDSSNIKLTKKEAEDALKKMKQLYGKPTGDYGMYNLRIIDAKKSLREEYIDERNISREAKARQAVRRQQKAPTGKLDTYLANRNRSDFFAKERDTRNKTIASLRSQISQHQAAGRNDHVKKLKAKLSDHLQKRQQQSKGLTPTGNYQQGIKGAVSLSSRPRNEEYEQIDELSKKTLRSYVKKAIKSSNKLYAKADRENEKSFEAGRKADFHNLSGNHKKGDKYNDDSMKYYDKAGKLYNKATKRDDYINLASKKMKEDLDEATNYKEAKKHLSSLGIHLHHDKEWDEYHVNHKGGRKATKYHTDDLDDAYQTGLHMAKTKKEEYEQIDELSKKTLGNYLKKATFQGISYALASGGSLDKEMKQKLLNKAIKRGKGIKKATDLITKEEYEQIDELSKDTLRSYKEKAKKSYRIHDNQSTLKMYGAAKEPNEKRKKAMKDAVQKHIDKAGKRLTGVRRAEKRLGEPAGSMRENIENLDELSNTKLANYLKKASDERDTMKKMSDSEGESIKGAEAKNMGTLAKMYKKRKKYYDTRVNRRSAGMKLAQARMEDTQEEYINEISSEKARKYFNKANDDELDMMIKYNSKLYGGQGKKQTDDIRRKYRNRQIGKDRAYKRMHKEDVDMPLGEFLLEKHGMMKNKYNDDEDQDMRKRNKKNSLSAYRRGKEDKRKFAEREMEEEHINEASHARLVSDNVFADDVARTKDGHVMARKSFFYKSGGTSEKFADKVSRELSKANIKHTIVDHGEQDKPFKGGAHIRNQSHWWVKIKVHDK